jgi:hypothetical protein
LKAGSAWHSPFRKSQVIDRQWPKEYGPSHSGWFRHSATSRRRL